MSLYFNRYFAIIASAMLIISSCGGGEQAPEIEPEAEEIVFAKGADVSWVTQMESEGVKFFAKDGTQKECIQLLRDECGVNAIRLRVWVNPKDGWCGKADVVAKAKRVKALGLRIMIDFHMSDSWADPGQQETPAAWKSYDLAQLKKAVAAHVEEVLLALKGANIEPEWVQIGNETRWGFLYPLGSLDNPSNFSALVTAGHQAVKAVFPNCKTIVHIDSGDTWSLYPPVYDALKSNNGQYDMIGLSIYPDPKSWKTSIDRLIENACRASVIYDKPVMVCEVGMQYSLVDTATQMMAYLKLQAEEAGLHGVFYWEPEAPAGYNGGYDKGCFIDGRPTSVLDCFRQ